MLDLELTGKRAVRGVGAQAERAGINKRYTKYKKGG